MGNGESTSRRIAMQRTDDGAIQISEDVMYRLKGQEIEPSGQVSLGAGESIVHEDELKMMIENAFLQGRKHEYEKSKDKLSLLDKEKQDILQDQEYLRQQQQEFKQKLLDLELEYQKKLEDQKTENASNASYKLELEEANRLLEEEKESFNQKNKSMTETVEKLVEEKGILENKFSLREKEIQQEFDKSVEVVPQKIRPLEQSQVCTESQSKVLECYKLHKKQPLKCAKEVKEFVDCVQETRVKFMQKHLIDGGKP